MLVCAQVWEVVDNAIDEVQAGCATRVDVELLPDGAVSITDDGRGVRTPGTLGMGRGSVRYLL